MATQHTVKSFDDELKRLDNLIAEIGGQTELQLASCIDALQRRDVEKAAQITVNDQRIDRLEEEIDRQSVNMLALRQPMARDLREIVGALKTASLIERIGDYAKNVAKRTAAIADAQQAMPVQSVIRLGHLAQEMVKDVLDAYLSRDLEKADMVRIRDRELDSLHTSLFREFLTYMMEDARNITACTHLLFVAKNFERVGDHATNIAEIIHFQITGERPRDDRPKGDATSYTVVMAPPGLGTDED